MPRAKARWSRPVTLLLRPLFRILLRQGMAFTALEGLAKRVYVDVAFNDAGQEALDLADLDPVGVDAQGRAAPSRRTR
jgi:hypothetical protein